MPEIAKIKAINVDYDRVASSVDEVKDKNFISESNILKSYWGDDEGYVEFVPAEDGTYLIEQNGIQMGRTDQEGFNRAISNGMKLGPNQKGVSRKNSLSNGKKDKLSKVDGLIKTKTYSSAEIESILSLKKEDLQKIIGTMSEEEYNSFIEGVEKYYDKQIEIKTRYDSSVKNMNAKNEDLFNVRKSQQINCIINFKDILFDEYCSVIEFDQNVRTTYNDLVNCLNEMAIDTELMSSESENFNRLNNLWRKFCESLSKYSEVDDISSGIIANFNLY